MARLQFSLVVLWLFFLTWLALGAESATTPNLSITEASQFQQRFDITFNAGMNLLDSVCQRGIIDKDLDTPPGSPNEGDAYIVASGTAAWSGHDDKIAYYYNASWNFATPNEGWIVWINDEDKLYVYNSGWVEYTESAGGGAGVSSRISDDDNDTYIETEDTPDEDIVRMGANGIEFFSTGTQIATWGNLGYPYKFYFLNQDAVDEINPGGGHFMYGSFSLNPSSPQSFSTFEITNATPYTDSNVSVVQIENAAGNPILNIYEDSSGESILVGGHAFFARNLQAANMNITSGTFIMPNDAYIQFLDTGGVARNALKLDTNSNMTVNYVAGEQLDFTRSGAPVASILDNAGMVIGATDMSGVNTVANELVLYRPTGNSGLTILGGNTNGENLVFRDDDTSIIWRINVNNNNERMTFYSRSSAKLVLASTHIAWGTESASTNGLEVNGNIYASGTITSPSLREMKIDRGPVNVETMLDKYKQIPIRQYRRDIPSEYKLNFSREDFETEEMFVEWQRMKQKYESDPTYLQDRYGIYIDDPNIPDEIKAWDDAGNLRYDVVAANQYNTAVIVELLKEIEDLKARVRELEGR